MIQAGIVGGTGYTGVELLRLLSKHPEVNISVVTSRSDNGLRVDEVYPSLRGHVDVEFSLPDKENLLACDVVFFATPNGTAMKMAAFLLQNQVKVIDLSADFRIKDHKVWEHWYGMPHECPDLITEAVYGLPEMQRDAIKNAQLLACPGCYPTAVQLALMPLLKEHLYSDKHFIADVKSGVSGAGRKAQLSSLMSECGESFKAYAASGHRHLPEINQGLDAMADEPLALTFVPHLTPMIRGIHATMYANQISADITELQNIYEHYYNNEAFVDVLPTGQHPDTRNVKGANTCQIALHKPQGGNTLVVLSVIDNLVKGAAGQAIQNMNIMYGLDERRALDVVALYP